MKGWTSPPISLVWIKSFWSWGEIRLDKGPAQNANFFNSHHRFDCPPKQLPITTLHFSQNQVNHSFGGQAARRLWPFINYVYY